MWHVLFLSLKSLGFVVLVAIFISAITCPIVWVRWRMSGDNKYARRSLFDALLYSLGKWTGFLPGTIHRWHELLGAIAILCAIAFAYDNLSAPKSPALLTTALSQAAAPAEESGAWAAVAGVYDSIFGNDEPRARVLTFAAAAVTKTGATLRGSVDPNGSYGSAFFRYGTDPTLLSGTDLYTSPKVIAKSWEAQPIAMEVSGLAENSTYYYRAEFYDRDRGAYGGGGVMSVTTLAPEPFFPWGQLAILYAIAALLMLLWTLGTDAARIVQKLMEKHKADHEAKHKEKMTAWEAKTKEIQDAAKAQQQQQQQGKGKRGQQQQQQAPLPPKPENKPWWQNREILTAFGADVLFSIVEHYWNTRRGTGRVS